MLNFGNKEFRNLQEQVLKNMKDIQDIEQGATVLADFGIKVVGQVESTDDLPNPAEYEGDYGDAYLVGEEAPYSYYIFTRAFEGQEEPSWFDLGEFPVAGPQGEQGPQGETGATPVITGAATISTLQPGQAATVSVTKSGTNASPTLTFAFAVPQGAQGIQGPQGAQGPQGPKGDKGDKGDKGEQGGLIEIVGIVATADLLPTPASLQKLDAAYLVGASPDYELYVQVGETPSTALWTNLGAINEGTVVSVNGVPQTVWEANSKISVFEGQLVNTLYGQAAGTGNGQTHVPYGTAATANYIAQRDANGQILVPQTPTASNQAASKAYVDSVAGSSPIQYQGDLIVGDSQGKESRLAVGSAGQVLTVNSSANDVEWADLDALPTISSGDAGKVLTVNSAETGAEWAAASGGGDSPFNVFKNSSFELLQAGTNTKPTSVTNMPTSGAVLMLTDGSYSPTTININSSKNSLAIGKFRYGAAPKIDGSIAVADLAKSSFTGAEINASLFLDGASDSLKSYTKLNKSLILGLGSVGSTSSSATKTINRSIVFGDYAGNATLGTGGYFQLNDTILMGSVQKEGSYYPTEMTGCVFIGGMGTSASGTAFYKLSGNNQYIGSCFNFGNGNLINSTGSAVGHLICGSFGQLDAPSDKFAVGAGTSTSARANCFVAGNNSTDGDYIKIGDTKITETQLQALLALLNA